MKHSALEMPAKCFKKGIGMEIKVKFENKFMPEEEVFSILTERKLLKRANRMPIKGQRKAVKHGNIYMALGMQKAYSVG